MNSPVTDATKPNYQISKHDIIQDYLKLTNGNRKSSVSTACNEARDQLPSTNSSLIFPYNSPNSSNRTLPKVAKSTSKEYYSNNSNKNQDLSKFCKNLSTSLSSCNIKKSKQGQYDSVSYSNKKSKITSLKMTNLLNESENFNSNKSTSDECHNLENLVIQLNQKIKTLENEKFQMRNEINSLKTELKKSDFVKVEKERDEYKLVSEKYIEISKQLGEEVIILRNQLDKFLYYKK